MSLGRTDPAFFRQHNCHWINAEQFRFRKCLRFCTLNQWRTPCITMLQRHFQQFFSQQVFQFAGRFQDGLQLSALFCQFILLTADLHLFKTCQLAQAGIKDVIGLVFTESKALHQDFFRLIFRAYDVDDFVKVQESNQQTFQQVQALLKSPDTQKQLTELSLEVVGGSAADFVSFARKESGDYAKFVKDFNITPQ